MSASAAHPWRKTVDGGREYRAVKRREEESLICQCRSGLPVLYKIKPGKVVLAAYCKKCKPWDYVADFREQLFDAIPEVFPELDRKRCKTKACPFPSMYEFGPCWYCARLEEWQGKLTTSLARFANVWEAEGEEDEPEEDPDERYTRAAFTLIKRYHATAVKPVFTGQRLPGCKCLLRCTNPSAEECARGKGKELSKCACMSHEGTMVF